MDVSRLKFGDRVFVQAVDNFGGPAIVVDDDDLPGTCRRVVMDDNNPPPFWAQDFELFDDPPPAPENDSRPATIDHIAKVRRLMDGAIANLRRRRDNHDLSKLASPEREIFDEFTPKLAATTYGSEEYRGYLAAMKPALDHHYAANSHHPEHYPDGICGMSLLDLLEMLVDWKAATLRHHDGSILRSIEVNQQRFGYSDELKQILLNTVAELGLAETGESTP